MPKKRKSVFYKYLFSNLIICTMSVSIVGTILYGQVEKILMNEINEMSLNRMTQLNAQIEENLYSFLKIASTIPKDRVFLPDYTSRDIDYSYVDVVNSLKTITLSNSLISDALLYYPKTGKTFSTSGALDLNSYNEFLHPHGGQTTASMDSSMLAQIKKNVVHLEKDQSGKGKYLDFIYPIPLNNSNPFANISFIVEYDRFQNMVYTSLLNGYDGNVSIYDNQGNLLIDAGDLSFSRTDFQKLTSVPGRTGKKGMDIYSIRLGSSDYSVSHMYSEKLGWNYYVIITNAQFMKQIVEARTFILMSVLMILLFMSVIALLSAFSNYRPVRNLLTNIMGNRSPYSGAAGKSNEFDMIKSAVDDISQSNIVLTEKLDIQNHALLKQIFDLMYDGKTVGEHWCRDAFAASGIDLTGKCFSVAVCLIDQGLPVCRDGSAASEIFHDSKFSYEDLSCFGTELSSGTPAPTAVILATSDSSNELKGQIVRMAANLASLMEKSHGVKPTIGIGGIYGNISKICVSLVEARVAIEGANSGSIIEFENQKEAESKSLLNYPEKDLAKLRFCLKQGNAKLSLDIVDQLFLCLELTQFIMKRYICYEIINTVIKTVNELGIKIDLCEISFLQQFSSESELKTHITGIAEEICRQVEERSANRKDDLYDQLIEYVNKNITEPNISLELVAQEFSISPSYLSVFFKEHAGIAFSNYIRNQRIREVKRLLVTSNRSIRDIITYVGYQDVSNFIRTFKSIEGLTPGDFRRLKRSCGNYDI